MGKSSRFCPLPERLQRFGQSMGAGRETSSQTRIKTAVSGGEKRSKCDYLREKLQLFTFI